MIRLPNSCHYVVAHTHSMTTGGRNCYGQRQMWGRWGNGQPYISLFGTTNASRLVSTLAQLPGLGSHRLVSRQVKVSNKVLFGNYGQLVSQLLNYLGASIQSMRWNSEALAAGISMTGAGHIPGA